MQNELVHLVSKHLSEFHPFCIRDAITFWKRTVQIYRLFLLKFYLASFLKH